MLIIMLPFSSIYIFTFLSLHLISLGANIILLVIFSTAEYLILRFRKLLKKAYSIYLDMLKKKNDALKEHYTREKLTEITILIGRLIFIRELLDKK